MCVAIEVSLTFFSPSPPGPDRADRRRRGCVLVSSERVLSVREGRPPRTRLGSGPHRRGGMGESAYGGMGVSMV